MNQEEGEIPVWWNDEAEDEGSGLFSGEDIDLEGDKKRGKSVKKKKTRLSMKILRNNQSDKKTT